MSGERSVFASIFRSVSALTLGRVVNAVCSFVYIAYTVRALGLSGYGLLLLIHSLAYTAALVPKMQSGKALIRFGNDAFLRGDMAVLGRVVQFCIRLDVMSSCVAVLIGLVGVQVYTVTAHWSAQTRFLADLYVLVIPMMNTGWADAVLRMDNKFHYVPIIDTCAALVKTAGVVAGYFLHQTLGYFLLIWALAVAIDYGFFVWYATGILKARFQFRFVSAFREWRWQLPGMWRFIRETSVNQTLEDVSGHLATLLVGHGMGPAEAAVFRVCRQIADGIVTPAQLISPVLFPELVRMKDREDWRGLKRVTWKMFGVLSGLSVLLLVLSAVLGSRIFRLLLHVHVPHTSFYISIMLLGAVFSLLVIPLEPLLIVVGHVRFLVVSRTAIMVVYLPALYVFASLFGLEGACFSVAVCNAAVLSTRLWGVGVFGRRIGRA